MASKIDTNQPFYLQSNVGTSVLADFAGGTLRIDQIGATDNNAYTVESIAGNTIDAFGHSMVFNGGFSGAGSLDIADSAGGGVVIVTGANNLGGTVTVDAGATLQWGNAGSAYLIGGGLGITDNGTLRMDFGSGGVVSGPVPISGSGRLAILSGTFVDSAACTYSGSTTINTDAGLLLGSGGSIANSSLVADNGTFDISPTSGASILNLTGSGLVSLGAQTLTITAASASFAGVLADGGNASGTGGSLTIAGGTETLTGANTYTGTTTINSGATLQLAAGGTVAGSIADNGLVRFVYSGAVTVANTFTGSGSVEAAAGKAITTGGSAIAGNVTIDNGATLQWGAGAAAFLVGGGNAVADNGTLLMNFGGGGIGGAIPISGSGRVTIQSGSLTESGVATYTGSTSIASGGFLNLSGGGSVASSSVVADNGVFDISGTSAGASIVSLTGSGGVSLGAEKLTITNASGTFSGALADGGLFGGTGGSLTIAGGTETLSGTNTYTGATTVSAGAILQLGAGGATGTVAGSIADNGVVRFDYASAVTIANAFSGSGSAEVAGGTVIETSTSFLGGTVTIDSGATLQFGSGGPAFLVGSGNAVVDNGTLLMNFGGGGIAGAIPISGSGRVTIQSGSLNDSGASTYTGNTVIDAGGVLALTSTGSVANSSGVSGTGTFDISGTSAGASITSLKGSGAVSLGGQVLTITNASGTFSGVLADGGLFGGTAGGLTIAGGTQTFTGNNTFTGATTINTGATLQLGSGGTAGSLAGHITLASLATLKIDHSAGTSETLNIGLAFAGGDAVTGGAGNETFDFGATLRAAEKVNGAGGTDTVKLEGNYAFGLAFGPATMINVETLQLGAGFDYDLTTDNATVASGKTLVVDASALGAADTLTFNGAAETNGVFAITGGLGDDALTGGTGNDNFAGHASADVFNPGLGNDTVNGGGGNDAINFTTGFTAADKIDGSTDNDTLNLTGNYAAGVTFNATTLVNVEKIVLGAGFDYSLTTHNATVAAGKLLTVDASALGAGKTLTFDGSAETNGRFTVKGGAGADVITGGAVDDTITGGNGDDTLNGGAGSNSITGGGGADTITVTSGTDTLVYTDVSQSTHATLDTLSHFDFLNNDHFDLDVAVTGIDTRVNSGTLSTATFDTDLKAAIGAAQLAAHHAVLFNATAGSAAGLYLVVDSNGTAGYQSGHDYVFKLVSQVNSGSLDVTDFT